MCVCLGEGGGGGNGSCYFNFDCVSVLSLFNGRLTMKIHLLMQSGGRQDRKQAVCICIIV